MAGSSATSAIDLRAPRSASSPPRGTRRTQRDEHKKHGFSTSFPPCPLWWRAVSMYMPSALTSALRALRRNRLQTSLTIVGMTIGVAAVLAMIAIGSGARAAIEDQIRAAGMNLIVVTAGNYKVRTN